MRGPASVEAEIPSALPDIVVPSLVTAGTHSEDAEQRKKGICTTSRPVQRDSAVVNALRFRKDVESIEAVLYLPPPRECGFTRFIPLLELESYETNRCQYVA